MIKIDDPEAMDACFSGQGEVAVSNSNIPRIQSKQELELIQQIIPEIQIPLIPPTSAKISKTCESIYQDTIIWDNFLVTPFKQTVLKKPINKLGDSREMINGIGDVDNQQER